MLFRSNVLNTFTTDTSGSVTALTTRTLSKSDISLGNVDNTSDANKPMTSVVSSSLYTLNVSTSINSSVFTKNLTVAENTVQKALVKLDTLVVSGSGGSGGASEAMLYGTFIM